MDRVEYLSDGLVLAAIENPKQRILPHDFFHALVESVLGVRGFTDLIFEGQNERAIQADDRAWLSEAMVESLQGMLWSGERLDREQFNSWVKDICEARKVPAVETTVENFAKLEQAIQEQMKKWERIPQRSSVEYVWEKV